MSFVKLQKYVLMTGKQNDIEKIFKKKKVWADKYVTQVPAILKTILKQIHSHYRAVYLLINVWNVDIQPRVLLKTIGFELFEYTPCLYLQFNGYSSWRSGYFGHNHWALPFASSFFECFRK